MSGLDRAAAIAFLNASRSRFVREASQWLQTFDDSADVLFSLSGDVGQKFGPWETFRFCALLGLSGSAAVQELARDVLSETPPSMRAPPIAATFAWVHASEIIADDDAHENRPLFERALARAEVSSEDVAFARDCAFFALGNAANRPADASVTSKEFAPLATLALEAALGRDDAPLAEAALASLGAHQAADGSVACEAKHPALRAMTTLRAVALEGRYAAIGAAPLQPASTND